MWWVKDPDRLKREVAAVDALREREAWLLAATPQLFKGLNFVFEFDVVVNEETFPFTLEYPAFFPETPPLVTPRDGRRLSDHQYGTGGELCLEYRPDNWDPSVTGAMMMESTYRLLSGERPSRNERAIVPSAHRISLGQQLRGSTCRFFLTPAFLAYTTGLPVGSCRDCSVIEMFALRKIWTAYVAVVGPAAEPEWQESGIPDQGYPGEPGILLRVESLENLPSTPDRRDLDRLIASARGSDQPPPAHNAPCVVLVDAASARMFYSFPKDGECIVIPFNSVDLSDEIGGRLSEHYAVLSEKKIGIVGCGSLGSKIAASLARCGVGEFMLVDDDIMKPGNLIRHELDVGSIGTHKVDAVEARIRAIAAGVKVSVRRVALGGQEASGSTASVLDHLASCDLLIDATADPQAFNFVASVARNCPRPMIWAEVYAGGIGGFVARVRPDIEPPPHAARRQYLAWCREQGVPWHGNDRNYEASAGDQPLVADDSDVAVIAAHATRMAVDLLARPDASLFPHPAYAIGLSAEWIFSAPFDTRPIDFVAAGQWQSSVSPARTTEAIDFMTSLFEQGERADRSRT